MSPKETPEEEPFGHLPGEKSPDEQKLDRYYELLARKRSELSGRGTDLLGKIIVQQTKIESDKAGQQG